MDVPDAEAKRVMYGQSPTSPTIRQENFMKHIIRCLRNIIRKKREKEVDIIQSHGGSGAQARSVVEGCNADVVTLALEHDITLIEQTGLIENGWEQEFADDSSPYTSTIVFLVRKGNPKQIKDWDDLVNKKVEIITPDPKSSGGACWNFFSSTFLYKGADQ